MNLEPLARYIDAIAPTGVPADGAHDGVDSDLARRRPVPAVAAAAAAVLALALATWSVAGQDGEQLGSAPSETSPTIEPSDSDVVVSAAGGPSITIELADGIGLARADVLVSYQVGSVIGAYGYDATVYESVPLPFDPCPPRQPCTEVGAARTNRAGLVVRSWAPALIPGAEPSAPTDFTVEAAGGAAVLALSAVHAGAPLTGDELVASLSYQGTSEAAGTFSATVGEQVHPFTWSGAMVQPRQVEDGSWVLLVSPGCDGADRCESGIGLSSLAPPVGDRHPIEALVASVVVER